MELSKTRLLEDALDHIARTCKGSKIQSRRIRWIQQRAEQALRGEQFTPGDFEMPKNVGPERVTTLQKRIVVLKALQKELIASLNACSECLQDWVDIADKEDLRDVDTQALTEANRLLGFFDQSQAQDDHE